MDFLRQHLPGLHQALRGALDSLSTFVSYLIGDAVPTVAREAQTAQVLEEVATGKPEKALEEEAWEAVEGLRGGQSEGIGGLGGSGRVGTCQEGSLAEQTWGWRAGTSHGSKAEKQDTGAWEAVKGQEPNDPLEARKESEAGPKTQPDRSSGAPENSKEVSEKEVSRGETPRTWEQQEEEDGWVTEQGKARGVESQLTWQGKPEQSADAEGPKEADRQGEEQEEAATETKGVGVKETTTEEVGATVEWGGESSSVLESTQGPGTDSEDWIASGNEETRIAPGREETDFSEVQEAELGLASGQRIPEVTGTVWVLEEAPKRDEEEEVDERGNVERNLLLKQTQALGPEGTEEAADGLTTERKTAGQKLEEAGEGSKGEDDLCGKETDGRPDLAIRVDKASLEEVVEIEESQGEEGHYQDPDASLVLDNEAGEKADTAAIPEATPEEEYIEERDEEADRSPKALEVQVTENQEPEPMGGTQTPVEQPEEEQRGEDELERDPIPSEALLERRLEAYPQHLGPAGPELPEAETWENRSKKGTESNVQEEKDVESEGEEAASQAPKAEAEGRPLSELLEIQTYRTEKGQASVMENQLLEESQGTEAEPGQAPTESEAGKSKAGEVEVTMPGEADSGGCRLEEVVLSLQDSQDSGTSSWDVEIVGDEAGEEPVKEAGVSWEKAFERRWESEGQEKIIEEEDQGEQEMGTVGPAEPTGQSSHLQAGEAKEKEQAEAGRSTMAEGTGETGDTRPGSQAATAEATEALAQAEELLEEAGGGQVREPREGSSEGQRGAHHPEGEAQKLLSMDNHVTGDQTLEAQETEPEALENAQEQEGQLPPQVSVEAVPVPSETTEAVESTRGDPGDSWSEALLPGSLLDVSIPRSRVLLFRSSSQHRSRPSFRRSPVSEQQDDTPGAQPQPGPSAPEPRPLQPEEAPEPSPPNPEGTPVPARRRPVGRGFGITHPGMMQELQARLARPKPQ